MQVKFGGVSDTTTAERPQIVNIRNAARTRDVMRRDTVNNDRHATLYKVIGKLILYNLYAQICGKSCDLSPASTPYNTCMELSEYHP